MARLSRNKTGRKHPPSHSEKMKAHWQDPEFRAKMAERDRKREEMRKAEPARFSRLGIPHGMRRDEAQKLWAVAEKQADKIIKTLKDKGILPTEEQAVEPAVPVAPTVPVGTTIAAAPAIAVPSTDAGMAEAVMREAFRLALGPTGTRHRMQALDIILKYTRLPPISVLGLAMGDKGALRALDEIAQAN